MKTIINIITTVFLFIFSMIYTKKAIVFLKKLDPLMREITDKENNYYVKPIDSIITKNYMIPGISGRMINIDKTYKKMKKLNIFSESLLVYDDVKPQKTINNKYDKVIIKGNLSRNYVTIILYIYNISDLYNINNILVDNNVTLDIYSNKLINLSNMNIKNIISDTVYDFTNYCLYNKFKINNNCINNKKYTINSANVKSLQEIKNTISNGMIYLLNINNNLQDLNLIIKYIKNNNYAIKTIDEMIKE